MLEGNSPNCSRLPHRYAISSPFFAPSFIISSAVLTDLFFDATNFSSHHNNCDTVSKRGRYSGGSRCRFREHDGRGDFDFFCEFSSATLDHPCYFLLWNKVGSTAFGVK